MLRRLPAKTFLDWQAYDELSPIGPERLDVLFAGVISWMVNLRRNVEKHPTPFPLTTFMLEWGKTPDEKSVEVKPAGKTWQQLKLIGQVMAASYNLMHESDKASAEARQRKRSRRKNG